jgi:hypothetical protein
MFQVLYEQMFFRLYEHERFHVNKVELSKQLLEGVARFYAPLMSQVNPYKLGEKSRSLEIGDNYATRILANFQKHHLTVEQIGALTDYLVNQCPDHGYVIDYDNIMEYIPTKNFVLKSDVFGPKYAEALSHLTGFFHEPTPAIHRICSEKHDQKSAAPEQNQGGETEGQQLEEEQDSQTKVALEALEVSEMFGIIAPSNGHSHESHTESYP